jgi:uncharacterized membrane protein YdjX (TVP38/TMEM64 family)
MAKDVKKANLLRALGTLVVVGSIVWAAIYRGAFDVAAVQTRIEAMGAVAPVAFVAIHAIAAVLFVPGSALTLAAGALFGPIAGAIYSLAGATIGATLAFILARYLVGDWVRRRTGQRLGELVEGIEREGWRFVAFVRLVPLFPYNVLNYALGLTRIPLLPYIAATLVCMAPGAAAYSYLGYAGGAALGGGAEAVKAGLWAIALLGLVALLPGFMRRRRAAASAATIGARELERKLEAAEPVCVLDVRSREEFRGPLGHIQGAVSIPVDQLPTRLAEVDGWRSRLVVPV